MCLQILLMLEFCRKTKHIAWDAPIATDIAWCGPNASSSIRNFTSTGTGCTSGRPGMPNWQSLAFPHMYSFPLSGVSKFADMLGDQSEKMEAECRRQPVTCNSSWGWPSACNLDYVLIGQSLNNKWYFLILNRGMAQLTVTTITPWKNFPSVWEGPKQ